MRHNNVCRPLVLLLKEKRAMKRSRSVLMVAVLGLSTAGCMSPSGRPDYTASGALAGGAAGAIAGSLARHPGPGALVGAAVGTVVGGLIGHGMDQAQEAQLRTQAPQTLQRLEQSQPLTVPDVKALVKAGITDDLIISQIRNSGTVYRLSAADIILLKNSGVSEKIIDFMINTPNNAMPLPNASVQQTVVVDPSPTYMVAPAVYPYPYWGWGWYGGGYWGHGHDRR